MKNNPRVATVCRFISPDFSTHRSLVEAPPVGVLLHVLLGGLEGLAVHVDGAARVRPQELVPHLLGDGGQLRQRQGLHVLHGLPEPGGSRSGRGECQRRADSSDRTPRAN